MSLYLDTTGRNSRSIAICDRCRMKMAYDDLAPDRNFPGLRVCPACTDQFDPWRLPARMSEQITLRFPRPDESITGAADADISTTAVAGEAIAGYAITGTS